MANYHDQRTDQALLSDGCASYTAAMSQRPDRAGLRRAEGSMSSRFVDRVLVLLGALLTTLLQPLTGLCLQWCLTLLASCLFRAGLRGNRSLKGGGSVTSLFTLSGRAVVAGCGFGTDRLAWDLAARSPLVPDVPFLGRAAMLTTLYGMVLQWRLTRTLPEEQFTRLFGRIFPAGRTGIMHVRTCFMDDMVETFVDKYRGRPCQLVVLGAGYDTRCQRLRGTCDALSCFEVDAPGTQAQKLEKLELIRAQQCRGAPLATSSSVKYVAVDFEAGDDWMQRLCEAGFRRELPSCFVWEGVTMYLGADAVMATLAEVNRCGPGSIIGFDYMDADFLGRLRRSSVLLGEPLKWGLRCNEAGAALEALGQQAGLELLDHLQAEQLLCRYCPRRPSGTYACHLGDFGGFGVLGK